MYPHAIRVLAKASPQAIASGGDELKSKIEAIVASPTATRDPRKVAQDILKKLTGGGMKVDEGNQREEG